MILLTQKAFGTSTRSNPKLCRNSFSRLWTRPPLATWSHILFFPFHLSGRYLDNYPQETFKLEQDHDVSVTDSLGSFNLDQRCNSGEELKRPLSCGPFHLTPSAHQQTSTGRPTIILLLEVRQNSSFSLDLQTLTSHGRIFADHDTETVGGTAGWVLASRLSEDDGVSVLLKRTC